MTLQEVFAQHFQRDDLEGAKKWFRKWMRVDEQVIPEIPDFHCTQRAMAGHVSDYLEGFTGEEPESYDGSNKEYYDTKHGGVIYHSA